MTPHRRRVFWWSVCGLYVLVLYATLPLGRPVIDWLRAHCSATQQAWLVNSIFAAAGVGVLVWLVRCRHVLSPLAYVCFVLFARLLYCEFRFLVLHPEERVHFLQYGVLAALLHSAFSCDLRGVWAYAAALALGTLIGLGDEGVQYLTKYIPDLCARLGVQVNPLTFRRYFGWNDVLLNVLGVAYGLAFWTTVVRNRRTVPCVSATGPRNA